MQPPFPSLADLCSLLEYPAFGLAFLTLSPVPLARFVQGTLEREHERRVVAFARALTQRFGVQAVQGDLLNRPAPAGELAWHLGRSAAPCPTRLQLRPALSGCSPHLTLLASER